MASTTTYDISYTIPTGAPTVTALNLDLQLNSSGIWNTVNVITNPAINTIYTYAATALSHEIYSVRVVADCVNGSLLVGDYQYLINPTVLIPLIGTPIAGPSIDLNWDCYIDVTTGYSLKEYILEYKDASSLGPWTTITIPKSTILTYWTTNLYPNYATNISVGINPATTYDIRLKAILTYDYITITSTIPTDVVGTFTNISVVVP